MTQILFDIGTTLTKNQNDIGSTCVFRIRGITVLCQDCSWHWLGHHRAVGEVNIQWRMEWPFSVDRVTIQWVNESQCSGWWGHHWVVKSTFTVGWSHRSVGHVVTIQWVIELPFTNFRRTPHSTNMCCMFPYCTKHEQRLYILTRWSHTCHTCPILQFKLQQECYMGWYRYTSHSENHGGVWCIPANVGPSPTTLTQYQPSIVQTPRVWWDIFPD